MLKSTLTASLLAMTLALTGPAMGHSGHDHGQEPVASSEQSNERQPRVRQSPGKDKDPHSPLSAYKNDEVLGWKMLVHEDLIADKDLYQEVRDEMHHQLFRITKVIPAEQVAILQKVPVWIEFNNPYSNNCQFHPSRKWLSSNGYLAEKAQAVEISNAKNFLRSSRGHQPFVMLHELSHAYHNIHLGFDHPEIIGAYKQAKDAGSYDKVLHMVGREVRAYAMTDHKEYFAEATEAYFGTNDHYPFVRPELKKHDPQAYAVLEKVWGVKK